MSFNWEPYMGNEKTDYPPTWKPVNVDDAIEGTVTEINEVETEQNGRKVKKPVLTLDTTEGPRTVWVSQVQLQRLMAPLNPQVGDTVSVRFTGTESVGQGRTMKTFAVKVEKDGQPKPPDDEYAPGEEPF